MTRLDDHLDSPKKHSEDGAIDPRTGQDLHEHELSNWKSPLGSNRRGVSSLSKSDHSNGTLDANLIYSKSTIKGRPHRRRFRNGQNSQTKKSSSTCDDDEEDGEPRRRAALASSVTPRGLMLAEMRSKSKRRLHENDEVSTVSSGPENPKAKSNAVSELAAPTEDEEECSDINDDDDDPHLPTKGRALPRSRTAPARTRSGGAGRSSRRAAAAERLLVEPPKGAAKSKSTTSVESSGPSSVRRLQSTRRPGSSAELQPSDGQRPANGDTSTASSTRRMRSNSVSRKASTRRAPPRTKSLDENLEIAGRESKNSSSIHRSGHSTSGRPSRGRKTSSSSHHGSRSSSKSRSRSRSHSRSRRHRRSRRHPLASSTGEKSKDDKRKDEIEQHRRQSDKHLEEDSDIGSTEFLPEQPPDAVDQSKEQSMHDSKNDAGPSSPKRSSSPKTPRSPKEYKQRSAASLLDVERPPSMEIRPSSVASSLGTSRSSEEDEISLENDMEGEGETNEKTEKQTITDMLNKSTSAFFTAANKSMSRLAGRRRNNQRQRGTTDNDVVPSTPVAAKALGSFLTLKKAPPDTHAQLEDGEESLALSIPTTRDGPELKRRSSFEGLDGEKRASLESFLVEDDKALHINMNKSLPSLMAPSLTDSPGQVDSSRDPASPKNENLKGTSLKRPSTVRGGENSDPLGCIPEDATRNGNYHTGNLEDLLFKSDDQGSNKTSQMHMSMNDLSRFTPLKQPSIRGFEPNHNSPTPKSPVSPSETPTDWRPNEIKEETPRRGDGLSKGDRRAVSMRANLTGSSAPQTPSGHIKSTLEFFRRTPSRAKSSEGLRLGRSRTAPSPSSVGDGSVSPMDVPESPTKLFKNGRPPASSSAIGDKNQPQRTKSGEGMLSMLKIARSISGDGLRAMSPASRQRSAPRGSSGVALPPSPLIVGDEARSRKSSRLPPTPAPTVPGKPPRAKSTSGVIGPSDAGGSPRFSSQKVGNSSTLSPETQLQGGLISLAAASPLPGKAGPTRILPVTMAAHQRDGGDDNSSNFDEGISPTMDNATEYLQLAFDGPVVPFTDEHAPNDEGEASPSPKLPPKPPIMHQ